MSIEIQALNHDGRGRGEARGKTCLVSQALPGEWVDVHIDRESGTTIQGRVRRWIVEEPTEPNRCPHVGRCTGCPLLRAPDSLETRFKMERVREWVGASLESAVRPLQRPSSSFEYRHYAKLVAEVRNGNLILGSYVAGTHDVADNQGCPVLAPALEQALSDLRERLDGVAVHEGGLRYVVARLSRRTGEILVVLVTSGQLPPLRERVVGWEHSVYAQINRSEGNVLLEGKLVHLNGERFIEDEILGFTHRIGPTAFFQVNPQAAEVMFAHAIESAGEGRHCIEGYCGVGVLTLPLSRRFERVSANELNPEPVAALEARGVPGLVVEQGRADKVLVAMLREPVDAVVLDPPRVGLGPEVARAVAESSAKRVVLLSCNPRSLAQDLPILEGRFTVESVTPFDQFPRTAHVETVTVLNRL